MMTTISEDLPRQALVWRSLMGILLLAVTGCGSGPLTVDAGPDREIALGGSARLEGTVFGAEDYEVSWTPADTLDSVDTLIPRAFPDGKTTYTLRVTTPDGREASDSVTVLVSDEEEPGIGTIEGEVTQRSDGSSVVGARVRIDLSPGSSASTLTDDEGRYSLSVPEVPEFFAMTVSKDGFIPASVNVARSSVRGDTWSKIVSLETEQPETIVLEPVPWMHHLGDGTFGASADGLFQSESEGIIYEHSFDMEAEQLSPNYDEATLSIFVRGAQESGNRIELNGTVVEPRLCCSPDDGSFEEQEIALPMDLLLEGENTLTVYSDSNPDNPEDHDDFEFVNIQVHVYDPA